MPTRFRRALRTLADEGAGRAREAWAVGLGLFIGCSPLIGFHLALCLAAGWAFGLNRLKLYLAANVINAFVLPLVLFAEVQSGALLHRGETYPLSVSALSTLDPWHFGVDLVLGTLVVGSALGAVGGGVTFLALGPSYRDPAFAALVRRAADRYLHGITAWQFARAKLRRDPGYRALLTSGLLPREGRLLDVGCGQGHLLALVVEARRAAEAGGWPAGWPPAPVGLTLAGIELRPSAAESARQALGDAATIETGDACELPIGPADAVVALDVLHLVDEGRQEPLVRRLAGALPPGGVLIVREVDAAAGWRFQLVRLVNRLVALGQGRLRARLAFRTAAGWSALLAAHGLDVEATRAGMTLGNVLLVGRKARPQVPASRLPRPVGTTGRLRPDEVASGST